MIFSELLRSIASYDAVFDYLVVEYPNDEPSVRNGGYHRVVAELLDLEPKPFDEDPVTEIVVAREPASDSHDEPWWHVYGRCAGDDQNYSLSFIDWAKLLPCEIRVVGIDLTPDQVLAHILWEITFYGFSNEATQEKGDELKASMKELDDLLETLPENPTAEDFASIGLTSFDPEDFKD